MEKKTMRNRGDIDSKLSFALMNMKPENLDVQFNTQDSKWGSTD
jgi:hypothetical protein